ncbi:hypothetical protein HK14_04070 [Acetobacter cibinongensis]|uniref:Uncharacterized protein n=1 Tax=Acetobacter cibinongensis TaxID=146475 RepID=A0A1Z5YYT1_9PROT|nr:hypothetical protein HK14_04070 [Acetobacter cibinongensis]
MRTRMLQTKRHHGGGLRAKQNLATISPRMVASVRDFQAMAGLLACWSSVSGRLPTPFCRGQWRYGQKPLSVQLRGQHRLLPVSLLALSHADAACGSHSCGSVDTVWQSLSMP